ncbi:MAG: TetR/AcrR family transcriptional regulator [Alicyclobacillus sp.]|nr:TetR/AcrR family transcriptional regulator [Alicyclobacillus sp.]
MVKGPERRRPGRPPASSTDIPTQSRILQAAARLFMEFGVDGVSMGQIAEASGLTKAVLYYYFRSKTDLFVEAVVRVLEISREKTQAILDAPEPLYSRLLRLMRTRLGIAAPLEWGAALHGSRNVLTADQIHAIERAEQALFDTVAAALGTAAERGEIRCIAPDRAARVFMSLVSIGHAELERIGTRADVAAVAKSFMDIFWSGIGPA